MIPSTLLYFLGASAALTVAPATVTKGEAATLSWTSQNATRCDIQPAVGAVEPKGSVSVKPTEPTAYTLTCSGAGGSATSTADVAVSERICITLKVLFDTDKAVINSSVLMIKALAEQMHVARLVGAANEDHLAAQRRAGALGRLGRFLSPRRDRRQPA